MMHSLQQSMENERNNPPVGNIPGSYLHNTIQYYPASSQAHLDRYGRPLYPENVNKLVIPNEFKRPSSAPLTPIEPKKIGRRFRRSSSVEEPNPDTVAMHEQEMRRNNGVPRYDHPSDISVRTSDGKLTFSEANRIVSSSHYPSSFNFRQEYDSKIKNERNDLDSKISYRPYMDSQQQQQQRPYQNIKKNLTERFLKAEEDNRSSTAYHSGASSRPSDNYFTYGQYAPPPPSQQDYYNKMNLPPRSLAAPPFRAPYSEAMMSRHKEATQMSDAIKRQQQHKTDTVASVQAMNTYFEMMANQAAAGISKDQAFARSRDMLIQKSGIHNPVSHSLADSHLPRHARDFQPRHPAESQGVPYAHDFHEKSINNPSSSIRYPPHDVREKGGEHQQSVIRGGLESSAASSHHGLPPRPPWPGASELPPHEKDSKRAFFQHPSTNPLECGCPYPKRHLPGECPKLRKEQFKGEAEVERFIRNNPAQYDVPNPYENPAYRRPEPVHPPELMSFHDKHHSDFMNNPPHALKEIGTPPLLKNEVLRPDVSLSPSNVKKTPRPGPIIIPPTINNKAIFSTPMGRPTATLALPHSIYTPPPMLSPKSVFFNPPLSFQRVYTPASTGYVCQTPRRVSLIEKPQETPVPPGSAAAAGTLVREESVEPDPKINVGPQFQATLPNVSDKSEAHKDVHRAGLMWSPLKEDKQKTNEVGDYLEMACSLSLYGGGTNKEYALHILQRTRGNVKEAIRLLLSRRHILRADDPNADYHYSGSTRWNAKERLAFRTAFRSKGKVFAGIQKEIGTKSVQLCVEFYYLWKAKHPESFRVRTRTVEAESEQDEDEVPPTPTAAVAPLSTLREPVFECDYPDCLARFISRQALNGHIRVHGGSHSKTPNDRRQAKEKAAHLASPKAGVEGGSMNSPPKRKKPAGAAPTVGIDGAPLQFQCKVCARVFSKVKSRSAHMKTHVKKDENNKTIKPSKNKIGPNEIVKQPPPPQQPPQHKQQQLLPPSHKPFDMLMHAVRQNAPPPPASYASQSRLSSNTSLHSTQPAYNQPMDTKSVYNPGLHNNTVIDPTKLYNPIDNPKAAMFNPPPDVSSPLFNPIPLDKNRIPFTTSMAASAASEKNPPNPPSTSMFEQLVDDKNAMPYDNAAAVATSKPAFDNNNNNSISNSISSMNTSS